MIATLLKNPITTAAGLLAIAMAVAVSVQTWRLKSAQADLILEQAAHTKTRADRDVLAQTVSAWKGAAERRATMANEARSQAAQYRDRLTRAETRLREFMGTGDECEDLRALIDLHRPAGGMPDRP